VCKIKTLVERRWLGQVLGEGGRGFCAQTREKKFETKVVVKSDFTPLLFLQ